MESKRRLSWLTDGRVLITCGVSLFAGFLVGMLIFGSPWHLPPAWGDIPTWITGIATTGLLAGAIVTAAYAIRAFRAQSHEISDQGEMLKIQSGQLAEQRKINTEQMTVLGLQAEELRKSLEERDREADQRHRAQASRVFIWQQYREGNPALYDDPPDYIKHLGPVPHGESRPLMVAHVKNASDQPVYDLRVRWTLGTAFHSEMERLIPLMPGEQDRQILRMQPGEDPSLFNAVAFFRDAAEARWRSRTDGRFDEIPAGQESAE
jgi:hypothetical protein